MNYRAAKPISRILVGLVSLLLMTAPAFSQPAAGPEQYLDVGHEVSWTVMPMAFTDAGVTYSSKECEDHFSLEPCSGFVSLRIDGDRLMFEIHQDPANWVTSPIVLDTPVEQYSDTFGNRLFRAHYTQIDASPYVRNRGLDEASLISVRHNGSQLEQISAEYQAELENLGFDVTIGRGNGMNFQVLTARGGDDAVHMLLYRNDGGVDVRLLSH